MSTQRKPDFLPEQISAQAVQNYLEANPNFFEHHSSLLNSLRVPHGSGEAVSLVERQVSMLRQKEIKLDRRLKDLVEIARANDLLMAKIHELSLQLLAARGLAPTIAAIEEAMRSGFGADEFILVLFGDPALFDDIDESRFFRVIARADDKLKPFATFLAANDPRCGQVRNSQRDFLFPSDANEIGSVALVPLGDKNQIGFLAIGSADADHFHPGMSVDYLARIGDLVGGALARY